MRPSKIDWALTVAKCTSFRSTCLRRQVGCVLLDKKGFILSTGFNGVAAGLPHCNELSEEQVLVPHYLNACPGAKSKSGTDLDKCEAIHAEQNALLQCRDVREVYYAVVTTAPCITCVKLLLNTGCQEIVFIEDYPHAEKSKELWEKAMRGWTKKQL